VDEVMLAATVFSLLNVILLLVLIYIYADSFRRIRAQFTAGLVFFSALFLVQNLITLYSFLAMFQYFAPGVEGLVTAITIVQTAGLAVLVWISIR
jgi:hypothetical protein